MKRIFCIQFIGIVTLLLLGQTESAWALQSHGAPEGIYVHQMAHVLFMGALAYLYWHTRRSQDGGWWVSGDGIPPIELEEPIEDRTLAVGLAVEVDRSERHPCPALL